MTVRDVIGGAFRLLGTHASGEQPTAAEANDALASLNSMIDAWQNERLMLYATKAETFNLVAGQQTYTMGPTGNFNTARPVKVDKVQMSYGQTSPALNLPIRILTLDQYQRIPVPSTAATFPHSVYVDNEFPLRSLSFYPVPTIVNSVSIFSWKQLSSFAALNDAVSFPPGYERALRYCLAVSLAPEYGVTPSMLVLSEAADAKAKIKAVNLPEVLLRVDPAVTAQRGGFNWITGE